MIPLGTSHNCNKITLVGLKAKKEFSALKNTSISPNIAGSQMFISKKNTINSIQYINYFYFGIWRDTRLAGKTQASLKPEVKQPTGTSSSGNEPGTTADIVSQTGTETYIRKHIIL